MISGPVLSRWSVTVVTALTWFAVLLRAPDASARAGEQPEVTARLVRDGRAMAPESQFYLGVQFQLQKGWHIYWRYPGEIGLPTKVTLSAGEDATVGELVWPVPETIPSEAGTTYGYEDTFVVFLPVDLKKGAVPDETQVKADVEWLACDPQRCIPGRKTLLAHLGPAIPVVPELFFNKDDKIPADAKSVGTGNLLKGDLRPATVKEEGQHLTYTYFLSWEVPVSEVSWYPALPSCVALKNPVVSTEGQRTTVSFSLSAGAGECELPGFFDSVLSFKDSQNRRRAVTVPFELDPKTT